MDSGFEFGERDELLAHLDWVQRVARAILRDDAAADDVAQDVARIALERKTPRHGLRRWLATIARRLAIDRKRADQARARREELSARREAVDDLEEVVERGARQQRVAQAVMQLPEPYRTAVLLRYLDGLS